MGCCPMKISKVWDDIILYKGRIYLSPQSKIEGKILKEYRDNPLAGHQGYYKTYKHIREKYSSKGLKMKS